MTVQEIAVRQEVRQMLNEAGINRNTLKDMVKEVLIESIDKAVYQALHESDVDSAIATKVKQCVDNNTQKIVREEIRSRVGGMFNRMHVTVDIRDSENRRIDERDDEPMGGFHS